MSRMGRTKLGDDARFDLSLGAAARERQNRPLGLVAMATAFVLVALVFAIYSVSARASSRRELVRALTDQSESDVMIARWAELAKLDAESPRGGVGQPGEFKISKMEDIATRAGMNKPNTPRTTDDKSHTGIVVSRYFYTEVRNPTLQPLLEWARLACIEIGGLEVEFIKLTPEPAVTGWRMDVTFRRWERAGP